MLDELDDTKPRRRRLRNLVITAVALCDAGANPHSRIMLSKRRETPEVADDRAVIAKARAASAALRNAIQDTWKELGNMKTEDDPDVLRAAVSKACATEDIVKYSNVRATSGCASTGSGRSRPPGRRSTCGCMTCGTVTASGSPMRAPPKRASRWGCATRTPA